MSPQKIFWSEQAKDQMRGIEQTTALRILHALANFVTTGNGDIKRLQDIDPPEFRLRVGDYRLRFRMAEGALEVTAVKHRRDVYR
jgi:mRNA interferase RelE/StbE